MYHLLEILIMLKIVVVHLYLQIEKTIGETVNIGSNTEISISNTLKLIKKLMSSDVTFINDQQKSN